METIKRLSTQEAISTAAVAVQVHNPFNPAKDRIVTRPRHGETIQKFVDDHPDITAGPVVCLDNGQPLMRKHWPSRSFQPHDVIVFYRLPLGGGREGGGGNKNAALAVAGLALIVIGAHIEGSKLLSFALIGTGTALSIVGFGLLNPPEPPSPDTANQLAAASPTYSLSAQGNTPRLGQSIPVLYGKHQIFPDFATAPYSTFSNNDQFLHHVLVIGQGEYDIGAIRIEDTPIAAFREITHQVVGPTESITLFPHNVITALEVSGQELDGPNNDGDWLGPFTLNPPGTTLNRIAIDIVLATGLYALNAAGTRIDHSVTFTVEARAIDDDGEPTGTWLILDTETITAQTHDAIRRTLEYTVATARYQIRAKRTTDKSDDLNITGELRWQSAKGYLTDTPDYSGLTLLAVRMKATENLSSQSSRRINVIATRKLPRWTPATGWSAPTATTSIVSAVADALRNTTYGAKWQDSGIDLQGLYEVEQIHAARGDTFSAVFDRRMSIWEAIKLICRAGRCAGVLQGGIFRLVRDRQQTLPVAMFTNRNIVKDSFSIQYQMASEDTVDGIAMEYINPRTWQPDEVAVDAAGGTPSKPARVRLFGCTNRDQARREALYMARNNLYRRKTVILTTELEGYIPTFGDLVAVSHDMPSWGVSGDVVAVDAAGKITLSEPVTFADAGTHYIAFRNKTGGVSGPWPCVSGGKSNEVILSNIWTISPDADNLYSVLTNASGDIVRLYYGGGEERTHFAFGLADTRSQSGVVKAIRPRGELHVELQILAEDNRVHQN